MINPKPVFVTIGEPSSIAAEITLKSWLALRGEPQSCFVTHNDPVLLADSAKKMGLNVGLRIVDSPDQAAACFADFLPVLPAPLHELVIMGKPDHSHVPVIAESISLGVRLCQSKTVAGMVTNPIHKSAMQAGGFQYPGHTEFLSHLCGGKRPVMMLANPQLRVVPLTVHLPLQKVSGKITVALIQDTIAIIAADLQKYFGLAKPRIAVAGLNPHAGEDGTIGREEMDVILPALLAARGKGYDVSGPFAADTLFYPEARKKYDIVLGMYHDQVLIPVKTIDFWNSVNVTLGLGIVRTSPDHGTALDIADRGVARADSLIAAIRQAHEMARHGG